MSADRLWRYQLMSLGITGPWDSEPDRLEWRHSSGLACLANRNDMGAWCGYVAIPPGHPLFGVIDTRGGDSFEVHGGITYSKVGRQGPIGHVPLPGESDDPHWVGFDCGHASDLIPSFEIYSGSLEKIGLPKEAAPLFRSLRQRAAGSTYRDLPWVVEQTNSLADQIAQGKEVGPKS